MLMFLICALTVSAILFAGVAIGWTMREQEDQKEWLEHQAFLKGKRALVSGDFKRIVA